MSNDTLEKNIESALSAPKLDPTVLAIANDFLSGKSIDELSEAYNVSTDLVSATLEKKEISEYINSVMLSVGYSNRIKRLQLINKVIDQKLTDALETGMYSKKDLFDWIKLLEEVENNARAKHKSNVGVAVQVNNYTQLMNDLLGDN